MKILKKDVIVVGNSFATKNMWDSDYRPEQMFTLQYLADNNPKWIIKTEHLVTKLTLDGSKRPNATLDIAVTSPEKIAIRLNGAYHFVSARQELKDEFQKISLEQAGWEVVDLDHHMLPYLFRVKKTSSDKTLKLAIEELDFIVWHK